MSVTCIENQPIPFDTQANCETCFNDDYCVLVETTDTTSLQFKLSPVTGDNVIPEGDMLPQASGTTTGAAAGKLIDATATFQTDGVLVGAVVYNSTDGIYYEVTAIDSETQLTISSNILSGKDYIISNWDRVAGTWGTNMYYTSNLLTLAASGATVQLQERLTNGRYYRAKVTSNGGGLRLENSTGDVYANLGSSNTESVFYFLAIGTTIRIVAGATVVSSTISELEIVEMSSLEYLFQDCDTGTELTLANQTATYNTGVRYADNPNAPFWGQIDIDWSGTTLTPPDCACLCVRDYAEEQYNYIWNGAFNIVSGEIPLYWTIDNATNPGYSASTNELAHADGSGGGAGTDVASQELMSALDADKCYELSFDYASDNGFTVTVLYDTATTTDNVLFNGAFPLGAGTSSGIAVSNDMINIKFSCSNNQEFTLDNIAIKLSEDCYYCSCLSSCISVATSHDSTNLYGCNTLFTGTCNSNAFGFNFDDLTFTLNLRLFAKLRNSGYNEESEYYTYSDGTKELIYAEREKTLELQVYEIPEGVHDALEVITMCDTFTIDGVEYVRTGDYTPNWRKSSQKAPVIMTVAKKLQNRFNTFS